RHIVAVGDGMGREDAVIAFEYFQGCGETEEKSKSGAWQFLCDGIVERYAAAEERGAYVIELRMMEDWTHRRGASIERSRLGIIYLTWDAWNGQGYEGLLQTHPDLAASWRDFAEAEGKRVFRSTLV